MQVATLLTVIGEDGREVYSTLRDWAHDGDDRRILPVLRKFAEYCQPRKNVPFERYKFNKRTQESGESYEQYKTTLRKLSEACEFDTITPNEIRVSSVVSPHSFSRSSYLRSLSPGMSLVALLCIFSSISMSFLRYGLHVCIHYSK